MANLSGAATNVTDKAVAQFYTEALPIHRELREAQDVVRSITGTLRNIYKRAKEAGVNEKAVARLLKERTQDADEVTKDEQDYIRYRVLTGAMPREQLSMFGELFAQDTDEDLRAQMTLEKVKDDGYFAGNGGGNRDANPFPAGSEQHFEWDKGYLLGQAKIVQGMAPAKRGRPRKPKTDGKLDPSKEAAAEGMETVEGAAKPEEQAPAAEPPAPTTKKKK